MQIKKLFIALGIVLGRDKQGGKILRKYGTGVIAY